MSCEVGPTGLSSGRINEVIERVGVEVRMGGWATQLAATPLLPCSPPHHESVSGAALYASRTRVRDRVRSAARVSGALSDAFPAHALHTGPPPAIRRTRPPALFHRRQAERIRAQTTDRAQPALP